jgi:hypothetical protein
LTEPESFEICGFDLDFCVFYLGRFSKYADFLQILLGPHAVQCGFTIHTLLIIIGTSHNSAVFFQKPKTGQLEAVVSEMKFYILVQSGMWLILAVG